MSGRKHERLKTVQPRHTVMSGKFAPNDTNPPTNVEGKGFTVARTGVGTFVVTFNNKYVQVVCITTAINFAGAQNAHIQIGAVSNANRTMELRIQTVAGVPFDVSPGDCRVHFSAVLSNHLRI